MKPTGPSSTAIFLVLRKMRAPLIVLVSLFSISVIGLTAVPGVDDQGRVWHMDLFEAFYFMSYTATTIGFGEIPYALTTAQRAWVIVTIYLSVIAWAYAIGSVLALLQERGFREALGLQRFERQVARMQEPFFILAGFGQAGEKVARTLDAQDRRMVVLDIDPGRIEALELVAMHSDVPGLTADASNPIELLRAGVQKGDCSGVLALTNDDEANLAVAMAVELLHPGLPAVSRTVDEAIAARMARHGAQVVDPFNLFGDELLLAARSPHSYRLIDWLTSGPGNELQDVMKPPAQGRWVVCGYGRFGSHLVADLLRRGFPVTIVDDKVGEVAGATVVHGNPADPAVLADADLRDAKAVAAATDSDTDNIEILEGARSLNPGLFLAGRQNDAANAALFKALAVDRVLIPTDLVAREVLQRVTDPMLWDFVQRVRGCDDHWAEDLTDRITALCGTRLPEVWSVDLTAEQAPGLQPHWESGVMVGQMLRSPEDRDLALDAVMLSVHRGEAVALAPGAEQRLERGDRMLLVGSARARRALDTTLALPTAAHYVITGRRVGQSWVWRRLAGR